MRRTVGKGAADRAVMLGTLFSPEEALKIKLVDQLVQSNNLTTAAEDEMKKWLKVPSKSEQALKS